MPKLTTRQSALFVLTSLILLGAAYLLWFAGRSPETYSPPDPEFAAHRSAPRKPNQAKYGPARPISLEQTQVSVTNTMSTCIAFFRNSEPPWRHGNYLTFWFPEPQLRDGKEVHASWQVVNMHADNFGEITRRLKLRSVEVRVLHTAYLAGNKFIDATHSEHPFTEDRGYALIVDKRIPRQWFLGETSESRTGMDRNTQASLEQAYPQFFRPKE